MNPLLLTESGYETLSDILFPYYECPRSMLGVVKKDDGNIVIDAYYQSTDDNIMHFTAKIPEWIKPNHYADYVKVHVTFALDEEQENLSKVIRNHLQGRLSCICDEI